MNFGSLHFCEIKRVLTWICSYKQATQKWAIVAGQWFFQYNLHLIVSQQVFKLEREKNA